MIWFRYRIGRSFNISVYTLSTQTDPRILESLASTRRKGEQRYIDVIVPELGQVNYCVLTYKAVLACETLITHF